MITVIVFVLIGIVTVAFFLYWALNSSPPLKSETSKETDFRDPLSTLSLLRLEPLPRSLMERVFSVEDWEFVERTAPKSAASKFKAERTALALDWLTTIKGRVVTLMDIYRRIARQEANLTFSGEGKLFLRYVAFLFYCKVLGTLLSVWGPFRVREMAGNVMTAAEFLSDQYATILSVVKIERLAEFADDSRAG